MNRETRNVLLVVGAVLAGLLLIGIVFSGRPSDAIVAGNTGAQQQEAAEEAPAGEETAEAPAEEAPAEEETAAAPADEAPAEETAEETAAAPADEAPAGEQAADAGEQAADDAEAAGGDAGGAEVALAGDPEAGERTFRQCQACHRVGEGAQNTVGPQLNGVVGRPIASVEGFNYSASMQALGEEGRSWTPDELRGFLADPQGYVPGTMMIYAGVRNEDDLENVIAYLATFEE